MLAAALLCLNPGVSAGQTANKDSLQEQNQRLDIVFLGDDTRVIIAPFCRKPLPHVAFIHVHEDENTSLEAAAQLLDSLGTGCLATLKHGMGRNISFTLSGKVYRFDPNRIFSEAGRMATLKKAGNYSDSANMQVATLAQRITLKYIDTNKLIIALHNNTNNGGLTIQSYQRGGVYENDAAKVYVNRKEDPDDFFYTVSQQAFDFFRKKGFNVMLQNNANVTDDGSLSVYAGSKGIDYINIEAEHGKTAQQQKMMLAVFEYIGTYYSNTAAYVPLKNLN